MRPKLSEIFALLLVLAAATAAQTTINVPADHATIQGAIFAASPGDTVLIQPGTYYEYDIDFLGKDITVEGVVMGAAGVVIDAQNLGRGIVFSSGESPAACLKNLRVSNGVGVDGGGMLIQNASPTIFGCDFVYCTASSNGGGIAVFGQGPGGTEALIRHSLFFADVAAGIGGAIYIGAGSSAVVENSNFSFNSATGGGGVAIDTAGAPSIGGSAFSNCDAVTAGGGILLCGSSSTTTIVGCSFGVCYTASGGVGGGVAVLSAAYVQYILNVCGECSAERGGGVYANLDQPGAIIEIVGGTFRINSAATSGGGLEMTTTAASFGTASGLVSDCVFAGNASFGSGGGLEASAAAGGTVSVQNCTLYGNTAFGPGGGAHLDTLVARNCIAWSNSIDQISAAGGATVHHSDVQGGFPGVGNINADPLLFDVANDNYELLGSSPCIDAGDPVTTGLKLIDANGETRILGLRVDMGAYEYRLPRFPGTGEDFVMETLVNGLGNPLDREKDVNAGDFITARFRSIGGTFTGTIPILAAQAFFTPVAPVPVFPGIAFSPLANPAPVVLIDGLGNGGPFGVLLLPLDGIEIAAVMPPGFSGISIVLQALVLTPFANNGIFASTDGHELRGL